MFLSLLLCVYWSYFVAVLYICLFLFSLYLYVYIRCVRKIRARGKLDRYFERAGPPPFFIGKLDRYFARAGPPFLYSISFRRPSICVLSLFIYMFFIFIYICSSHFHEWAMEQGYDHVSS
jgi:hypothetical protein